MTNEPEQNCCAAFWGPTKPFFGGNATQAGRSYYLSTTLFAAARCLLSTFLLGILIYLIVIGMIDLWFVMNWTYILLTFSYTILALCSVLVLMGKLNLCNKLAKFVVPVYFVAVSATLFITPMFYLIVGYPPFTFAKEIMYGGAFVVYLVDIFLGARYRFCIQYTLLCIAYLAVDIAVMWIRFGIYGSTPDFHWQYFFLDPKDSRANLMVGLYVALLAWNVVTSVAVLLSNRIISACMCCRPNHEDQA